MNEGDFCDFLFPPQELAPKALALEFLFLININAR